MQLKHRNNIFLILILSSYVLGCLPKENSGFGSNISTDSQKISAGRKSFDLLCSSCHDFEQDAIGPNLSGLTHSVETSWIKNFIADPPKMIEANDMRALALIKKYKVLMPNFKYLSGLEVDEILSYLHTFEKMDTAETDSVTSVQNPIKDTISYAGFTAHLEFIAQAPALNNEGPLTRINKLSCENGSGRLFVNDLSGFLYELKNGKTDLYLPLKELRPDFIDRPGMGTGFGSFAFHPEFTENGLLYTTHTETAGSKLADFTLPDSVKVKFQWVVTEWKLKQPDALKFSGSQKELMRFDFIASSHGLQEITFNSNAQKGDSDFGMLYIGLGDGGSVQVGYPEIADHHGSDIWGSILRIDPLGNNSVKKNYGIPDDNPFVGSTVIKNEIWAYGFRNPNRITWDNSGRMLASDIGQANIEELNIIEAGKFYGWPIREGTFMFNPYGDLNKIYPLPKNDTNISITYPMIQYDHDEGSAISGGFVSHGKLFKGNYIFGDIPTGRLFISDLTSSKTSEIEELNIAFDDKETTFHELLGSVRVDLKFGKNCRDEIYVFTKTDGRIYRLKEF